MAAALVALPLPFLSLPRLRPSPPFLPSLPLSRRNFRRSSPFCSLGIPPALRSKPPLSAPDLQNKFGCQGLQFTDIAGTTVAELALSTGTSARVLLQDARITSYKVKMWHGGLEEFLHTEVSDEFLVSGGVFLAFTHEKSRLSLIGQNWLVRAVEVNPEDYIQIILTQSEDKSNDRISLEYVITLSNNGLGSAVIVSNTGQISASFTGSVSTELAVRSLEAVSAVGLRECRFCSPVVEAAPLKATWPFMEKIRKLFWSEQAMQSGEKDDARDVASVAEPNIVSIEQHPIEHEGKELSWSTEPGDVVPFRSKMHKVYIQPPVKVRFVDEGLRRSVVLERLGFENLLLSSPEVEFESDDEDVFVCVGSASLLNPVVLSPGQTWKAAQIWIPDS